MLINRLPGMKKRLESFRESTKKELEGKILNFDQRKEFYRFLPDRGLTPEEIVGEATEYKVMGDVLFERGRVSGAAFADNDENYQKMMQRVFFFTFFNCVSKGEDPPPLRRSKFNIERFSLDTPMTFLFLTFDF